MKKLFLLSLVASIASVAATTGHVRAFNINETDFVKDAEIHEGIKTTKSTFALETEVKVADSGFSFGGLVKAKELEIFKPVTVADTLTNVKTHSNVWAKYELPELMGVKSFVKGTYFTEGVSLFEADANYKVVEDITVGLNSKTKVPLNIALIGDKVVSTHKVYAKGNYMMVKGIDAKLGLVHDWNYDDANNYALRKVFLRAKASYEDIKDLKLTAEVKFDHTLNTEQIKLPEYNDEHFMPIIKGNKYNFIGLYSHYYTLKADYTGIKDLTLSAKGFVQHFFVSKEGSDATYKSNQFVHYGIMPEVTYKGIENITLSSKNVLSGITVFNTDMTKPSNEQYTKDSLGLFKLNAMAEYEYKATDKLTVKPSADVTATLLADEKTVESVVELTPAVNVEYKANENLTVKGGLKSISRFENKDYTKTTVKTNLEVKYTW